MILGAVALGRGVVEHGFMMPSSVGSIGLGVMARRSAFRTMVPRTHTVIGVKS